MMLQSAEEKCSILHMRPQVFIAALRRATQTGAALIKNLNGGKDQGDSRPTDSSCRDYGKKRES
jgi:hypothetical protein